MANVKVLKRGDLASVMSMSFAYTNGVDELDPPIDTPATLSMINKKTGVVVIDATPVTISSVTDGVIAIDYQWVAPDTDMVGAYRAEIELLFTGKPLSMPTIGYLNVLILRDINP